VIGALICLFGLMFQWTPDRVRGVAGGITYIRGTTSDYAPQYFTTSTSGETGLSAFRLLAVAALLVAAFKFKQGAWPKWARYGLLAIAVLFGLTAIEGFMNPFPVGPFVFTIGLGLVGWATYNVFQNHKV
jgi:hypothetical protein